VKYPAAPGSGGRLAGKRAVVTGAGSGIGRATAERFAAEGARVAAVDVDAAAAARTADVILRSGGEAVAARADVSVESEIAMAVARAAEDWGGLDVVIANAAVEPADTDAAVDELDTAVWMRVLEVNLTGVYLTCKHGVRALLASGGGAVVCTASPTGLYGLAPGEDAYSASKAGVYGLIRVMASDYARRNIRVNGVMPGFVDTPLTRAVVQDEALRREALRAVPLGRVARPEEISAVMTFLASDEASYVTGAVWAVDGGMTAV
jgi:NAD(P)-dependent dehydrogenase (short-subunit alcohol dehydrogenase family)